MKSIELFAGAGGLSIGLEKSGWESQMLIEKDSNACNTLRFNKNNKLNYTKNWNVVQSDVRDISFNGLKDKIDLVVGGPPCQPFSLGGKHSGRQDERDMFPEAIRAVNELQPKYFIFENVKGLLREAFSQYFEYIILRLKFPFEGLKINEDWTIHKKRLQKLNSEHIEFGSKYVYRVSYKLVDAAKYGVPQHRHRVIIVGVREDQNHFFEFPDETHCQNRLLYSKYVSGNYWKNSGINIFKNEKINKSLNLKISRLRDTNSLFLKEELSKKRFQTVFDAINNLPEPAAKNVAGFPNHILKHGAKPYPGHTGSRLHFPSKAIKAGSHGVPGGENMINYENGKYRYYTTREAARIQTFPDDYTFTGSWTETMRQIGNAVPVKLGYTIGKSLYEQVLGIKRNVRKEQTAV